MKCVTRDCHTPMQAPFVSCILPIRRSFLPSGRVFFTWKAREGPQSFRPWPKCPLPWAVWREPSDWVGSLLLQLSPPGVALCFWLLLVQGHVCVNCCVPSTQKVSGSEEVQCAWLHEGLRGENRLGSCVFYVCRQYRWRGAESSFLLPLSPKDVSLFDSLPPQCINRIRKAEEK